MRLSYSRLSLAAVLAGVLSLHSLPSGAAEINDEACWQAARKGDPAAYECMGDSYMRMGLRELAVAWYGRAAEYGQKSARNKLHRLGIEAKAERERTLSHV